jgi:hypothetical protein
MVGGAQRVGYHTWADSRSCIRPPRTDCSVGSNVFRELQLPTAGVIRKLLLGGKRDGQEGDKLKLSLIEQSPR